MDKLHTGCQREQFHSQMAKITNAGGSISELARLRLGQRNKFGNAARWYRRVYRQHRWQPYQRNDRYEVTQRVVWNVLINPRIDRHRGIRGDFDRVAVRGGLF